MNAITLDLPGGDALYVPALLSAAEASALMSQLARDVKWRRDSVTLFGKTSPIPRQHQWFGPRVYTWSGITMLPQAWPASLLQLKAAVESVTGDAFNSALVNLYRDGGDTVGWHADDELEIGPVIASVSLGAVRDFQFRRTDCTRVKRAVKLEHGSLLVMRGETQQHWQHCLPRRAGVAEPRINITFRQLAG